MRARVSTVGPREAAIGLLACLFLLTTEGVLPQPATAAGIASQLASTRRSQHRAETTMRRTDRKIKSLRKAKQQSRKRATAAARHLSKAKKRREGAVERLRDARERLVSAQLARDRVLRVRPNPAGIQVTDRPDLRKQVTRLTRRVRTIDRKVDRLQRKAKRARKVQEKKAKAVRRIKQRVQRKLQRRETFEDKLGASIKRGVELAQQQASVRIAENPGRSGFRRPARGVISQGYGCQRSKRGGCLRFHDGIDIATRRGARVRASAAGFVAYVGWNPWDEGKRAFIVIVGHAGGYETLYGHLLPVRKVRAGQLVRRGQTIGRAGSTGHSTGPHVHWEVSRGFRTLDPRSVGR